MDIKYKRAYAEVVEILRHIDQRDYSKIPRKEITFFREHADKKYNFKLDPNSPLERQNISREANAILISLFLDYFVTPTQKKGLEEMLNNNMY